MPTPTSLPRLPEHLEAQLLQFDASWNNPGVEQLRAAYPLEADEAYLLELIHIDAQKRVAAGLTADEALYLEAFPVLQEKAELLQKVRGITFIPMQAGDSVLRALAATTPMLQQVNLPAMDPQVTTAESPSKLPEHRYKLEGEIARGGMGAVLRGRDEDLGREIAVKVMLQNHAGKTELLQRFVEEAQIAGQLQHPGITPVYELGRFPDQRPYFTMKLVRGQTLAKLLKDRTDPSSERPRFLKIFEQICQTLAYAHTRKVIHRDLKPHNIMVGSFGEVQVMDWGLAKVLTTPAKSSAVSARPTEIPEASEGSVQTKRSSGNSTDIPNTQAGSILGTPAYMAPEQAKGDIDQLDERTDVFGLGAILCEILTGQPPYVGESGVDVYRQAVDADLGDALLRLDSCGADAEVISLAKRCLSAKQEDRFRDASALTKELTNYLHSVEDRLKQAELTAVEAKTKAAEENKRRRVTFRLAAVILLTLLVGLAASLWQMRRAMDADEQARENEATAKAERDEKEVQRSKAEKRLTQVEKGVELFAELVNGINPREETKGGLPLYQQLLERAEKAADQLQPEVIADPVVVARLQILLGNTLNNLGNSTKAESILRKAIAVLENDAGSDVAEIIMARNHLAESHRIQGDFRKALEIYRAIKDKYFRPLDQHSTLRATIDNNLALIYKEAGNYTEAMKLFEQLCNRRTNLKDCSPEEIRTHGNLAMTYFAAGKVKEALELSEKVLAALSEKLGASHYDTLVTKANMAGIYSFLNKESEAIQIMVDIVAKQKDKFGDTHINTLVSLNNLAGTYVAIGRVSEGLKILQDVCSTYETKYQEDHPERMRSVSNLGVAYYNAGNMPAAISCLTKASELQKSKLGEDHADTLSSRSGLARALRASGKVQQAIELFEHVREKQLQKFGDNHILTMQTTNNLAEAYRNKGQLSKTVEMLEKVMISQVNNLGPGHTDTLIVQGNLSSAYHRTGKIRQAVELIEKTALEVEKQQFQHRFAKNILQDAVDIYEAAEQYRKAEEWKRKLVKLILSKNSNNSLAYANELSGLALNLLKQKKWTEAEGISRECLTLRENMQPQAWSTFNTQSILGASLLGQKKYSEAEPLLIKGYEGMKQREKLIPAQASTRLPEALDRLIQLYTETNKPDELKRWQVEKEKLAKP